MTIDYIKFLRQRQFIGPFPLGIEVLLVGESNALDECRLLNPDLTLATLRNILKTNNIHVFSTIDAWVQYKKGR